jgi:antiphage defense system Thoeris ThsB-like protein
MSLPESDGPGLKFWAFISYSHVDRKWGDCLHRALETYRPPRSLIGKPGRDGVVRRKNPPIFRDREELPSSASLSYNINDALRQSRYLIVICSPHAAVSRWVNEEIIYFKSLGREDRVLSLIVEGEPNASDKPESGKLECFPPDVRFRVRRGTADGPTHGTDRGRCEKKRRRKTECEAETRGRFAGR